MLVEHLKQQGTSHSSRDLLKICVKMKARLLERHVKYLLFLELPRFSFLKIRFTSSSQILCTGKMVGEEGRGLSVHTSGGMYTFPRMKE